MYLCLSFLRIKSTRLPACERAQTVAPDIHGVNVFCAAVKRSEVLTVWYDVKQQQPLDVQLVRVCQVGPATCEAQV